MTDSTVINDDSGDPVSASPAGGRVRPGPVHQALYNQILADVMAEVTKMLPTFGTVVGMQGGKVLVQGDEDSQPRTVGLVRKKGQRYQNGERVKIAKARDGSEFVDGTFSSKDGDDPAVDSQDLFSNSVKNGHINQNAVTGREVKNNEISDAHLTPALSGRIDNAKKAGDDANVAAGKAQADADKANTAIGSNNQAGSIRSDIKNASDKTDTLSNKVFGGGGEGNPIVDRIQAVKDSIPDLGNIKGDISTIKADIVKLKADVKKLKGGGSGS